MLRVHQGESTESTDITATDSIKIQGDNIKLMDNGNILHAYPLSEVDSVTFFTYEEVEEETRWVGGDISMLPRYEGHGNPYFDINGNRVKPLEFFKQLGWNAMRVRLFVEPSKASREDIGSGVVQDLPFVIQLGRQIKEAGFKFMLDFHYSDSWADPGKQTTPSSWRNANAYALNDTLYNYTASW